MCVKLEHAAVGGCASFSLRSSPKKIRHASTCAFLDVGRGQKHTNARRPHVSLFTNISTERGIILGCESWQLLAGQTKKEKEKEK